MKSLERVKLMAGEDPTWDLSPNDIAALHNLIVEVEAARALIAEIKDTMCYWDDCDYCRSSHAYPSMREAIHTYDAATLEGV